MHRQQERGVGGLPRRPASPTVSPEPGLGVELGVPGPFGWTPQASRAVLANGLFDAPQGKLPPMGWSGFGDMRFMADSFGALLLAIVLGALIAFHPTVPRSANHRHDAEMRKVYIMYAFVGAVIGVTVREFGMVVGVVVFGIGGLIRFRTATDSTVDTGRLIAVTLTGLIAGLGLPHLAVITALFTFALIFLFEVRPASHVRIEQLPTGRVGESAEVYRGLLHGHGCKIVSEQRSIHKGRVEFVYRPPRGGSLEALHAAFAAAPPELRGDIDWDAE